MHILSIKELSLNEEMDSNDMAAIAGGRMVMPSLTHNLTGTNAPPVNGPSRLGISGELFDLNDDGDDTGGF